MERAGLGLIALALAGCGLVSKDFEVSQAFQAGGGPPSFSGSFNSTELLGPLSADVSKVSSITLKAARIEATDANGDISFISGADIFVSAQVLPAAKLASLGSPPASGQTRVELQILPKELKPFLQAGGTVAATISYSPTPINARDLRLTLTLHGSLL
jgi:hypothetical protein